MSRSVALFITPVLLTHLGAAGIKNQHVKRELNVALTKQYFFL